jgi:hypothetical protein
MKRLSPFCTAVMRGLMAWLLRNDEAPARIMEMLATKPPAGL